MKHMRKRTLIVIILVMLLAGYEIAFRCCTATWGEINTGTTPVSLYYPCDLMLGARVLQTLFAPRAALALGKVRLAEGTDAYISGGKFFRKRQDGSWQDLTAAFQKRQEQTRIESGGR